MFHSNKMYCPVTLLDILGASEYSSCFFSWISRVGDGITMALPRRKGETILLQLDLLMSSVIYLFYQ